MKGQMEESDPPIPKDREHDFIEDRAIASASEDKLGHVPLAEEVAQLAQTVTTPAAIGLFGPWGSGKSSLLSLIRGTLRSTNMPVVYLDAWKYAEIPLARQFISATAEQLSQEDNRHLAEQQREKKALKARRRATSRLYESRRTRSFTLKGARYWLFGLLIFIATLVMLLGLAAGLVTVMVEKPWDRALEAVLLPALGGSTLVALTTFALTGLTAETEMGRPGSEEEFEEAFRDIVETVVGRGQPVTFLVDELDRCTPSEVLATLETLRIFLDVKGCIFIVAGDRQVIEDALLAAPIHGAPPRPRMTYYAMAGSFLDKIFQIQLDLPPLNEERLTEFVFRLLQNQGGIWADPNLDLEELIPILIPSHVRSPRRAKVLLNAFALALRLARTRYRLNSDEAVDPAGQESALAKLVVLRTEFPLFADELPEHPALVEAMTNYLVTLEDEADSPAEEGESGPDAILDKFPEAVAKLVKEFAENHRSVEQLIPSASESTSHEAAVSIKDLQAQRSEELMRYLTSTVDTPHPDRNLIFGTVIGRLYDLDGETAMAIESGALDGRRREVEQVFLELNPGQQVAAIKLLCDLATKIGLHGRRAMEALVTALEIARESDLSDAGTHLSKAVASYTRRNEIPDEWAPLLLNISRWVPTGLRVSLQSELLSRDAWQQSGDMITDVFASAPYWEDASNSIVSDLLPSLLSSQPGATTAALLRLEPNRVKSLWAEASWTALAEADFENGQDRIAEVAAKLGESDRTNTWAGVRFLLQEGQPQVALWVAEGLRGAQSTEERLELLSAVAEERVEPSSWTAIAELING